jgi:hypothetical protein
MALPQTSLKPHVITSSEVLVATPRNEFREALQDFQHPNSVLYSTALCMTAFTRPPFSETMAVNGINSPSILAEPSATSELLFELYNLDDSEITFIQTKDDQKEHFRVSKGIILDHINRIAERASSRENIATIEGAPCITPEAMEELRAIYNLVYESPEEYVELTPAYPIKEILGMYKTAWESKQSILLMKFRETGDDLFDLNTSAEDVPTGLTPTFLSRCIVVNDEDTEKRSLTDYFSDELAHYIGKQNISDLREYIGDRDLKKGIFMGEIAKFMFPESNPYGAIDTSIEAIWGKLIKSKNSIPEILVAFTYLGSGIAKVGKFFDDIARTFSLQGKFLSRSINRFIEKNGIHAKFENKLILSEQKGIGNVTGVILVFKQQLT